VSPKSPRSRALVRRQWLFFALLAACIALGLVRLPEISSSLISVGLGGFFKRPVTVGEVRFHLSPLEVEILELRVGGARPDLPPFLHVPRIVAVPSLGSLWGQRVVLDELRFEGLELLIHAWQEGGDDIPKMGGGGGGGVQVTIGRLEIRGGSFTLDHQRVPLDLALPDFRGELRRRAGLLSGNLSFGPGRMRFGEAESFPIATDLELVVRGSNLDVPRGRLWTERIQLDYKGQVQLARRPSGQFALLGRIDLDELDRNVMRTGFGIKGQAGWEGELRFLGSQLVIEGRMRGTDGEFDGTPVQRFDSHVYWGEGHVRLADLEVDTMQGRGRLAIDLAPKDELSTMRGQLEAVDAEDLTRLIFDIAPAGFAGRATGPFDVRWRKGHFDLLTGSLGADIEAARDGIPLGGRFDWNAREGLHHIEPTTLVTPATRVQLEGTIQDRRTNLSVEATSSDLAQTDEELRRLRRALGTADAIPVGFGGRGRYQGLWGGTIDEPVFSGRLDASDISWLGVDWGRAEWRGRVTPRDVVTQQLVLERDASGLTLSGRTETGYWGEDDRLDLEVELHAWPAGDLIRAFDWDVDFQAPLTGSARVRGRRSVPEGYARVEAPEGRYYGIPFFELSAESMFGGSVAAISRGSARLGGGELDFHGSLTDTGVWDGVATGRRVELASLDLVPETLPVSGLFDGEVTLQGALERPRLVARLESPEVYFGEESLGPVRGGLDGAGDGRVRFEATSKPEVGLSLRGQAAAAPPWDGEFRVEAREARLDPFLRALWPRLPPDFHLGTSGFVAATGRLDAPQEARVELRLAELEIGLPDYAMHAAEPISGQVDGGRLSLGSFRLAGEGTDLAVDGGADLVGRGLDVRVRGEADLRFLQALEPRLRGRGSARLDASVGGSAAAPRVEGTLQLDEAALRLRGIPHGLDDVRGLVRFTESAAEVEGLVGSLGGGEVRLAGQVGFGGTGLASMDLEARGRSISLRWPEGLSSRLDSELRIFGDAERQWITGSIEVRRAEWTRRYDLASELLAGRAASWEPEATLSEGVRLDIRVEAPGTLRIDNNLASLQASADLRLQGTVAAPVLVGRAELDRGRVYFQGNTYVIRRGTIDFADAQRTQPLFDVEAETRVRSYRVTLRLNGTLERVVPTLTSDPPLSPIQILNLLAGADESAVASLAQAQAEQARLAAAGAATLAASRLTEEVGLERGAERLLGLNRFSIDPSVLRGDFTNPTARLTLGKRITPDLNVQYSQDLSSDAEHLFTLEYTLSDRLSILLTQAEPGGFGLDIRVRQTR